jgi:hypothetical protein
MKIVTGIASTTHIDRHHDQMTKEALEGAEKQTNSRLIPYLIDHDWNQQVGVILYGKVFRLDDGEYGLGIVAGIYENESERTTYAPGMPNIYWNEYRKYLDINALNELLKSNIIPPAEIPKTNIADLLERYLDSTEVLPDGTVYEIKRFIAATGDLRIEVYPGDHKHFHVISKQRNIDARFDAASLDFINNKSGNIKPKDIIKIQSFLKKNPDILNKLRQERVRLQD